MTGGMNDDEAQRCLEKAEGLFRQGNAEAAERLARKSLRMFSKDATRSRQHAEILIEKIVTKVSANPPSRTTSAPTMRPQSGTTGIRNRKVEGSSGSDYNPETEAKCQAILRAKDYYMILAVKKEASAEEVKKAYRKLALQFHPDKAKCPSAEAAFKELAKAYQCLSDPQARKYYDVHGSDEDASQQAQYHQRYESHFMSPEELFESFFGVHFARGPYAQQRVYRTRVHNPHAQTSNGDQRRNLVYSIHQPTVDYSVGRLTSENRVPYFVQPGFHRSFSGEKLQDLEIQIEMSYYTTECTREQQRLLQQLSALKYYGTAKQYRNKAEEIRLKEDQSKNCRNAKILKSRYPHHAQQRYRQTSSSSVWM